MTPMRLPILMAVAITFHACNTVRQESTPKFDSAHSIALDGQILDGQIITQTDNKLKIKQQIKEQLRYTIGFFNNYNGGVDLTKSMIEITEIIPLDDDKFDVRYITNLFVAWPRADEQPPAEITLILPKAADEESLEDFFEKYGSDELKDRLCLAFGAHDVSPNWFWYSYRPENKDCPLHKSSSDVVKIHVAFNVSSQNTQNKYPEYHKIWEDGRLEATMLIGKNISDSMNKYDSGTIAYARLYELLVETYGKPSRINLDSDESPDAHHPVVKAIFKTPSGELDVQI